jgi:hypothetical protein
MLLAISAHAQDSSVKTNDVSIRALSNELAEKEVAQKNAFASLNPTMPANLTLSQAQQAATNTIIPAADRTKLQLAREKEDRKAETKAGPRPWKSQNCWELASDIDGGSAPQEPPKQICVKLTDELKNWKEGAAPIDHYDFTVDGKYANVRRDQLSPATIGGVHILLRADQLGSVPANLPIVDKMTGEHVFVLWVADGSTVEHLNPDTAHLIGFGLGKDGQYERVSAPTPAIKPTETKKP